MLEHNIHYGNKLIMSRIDILNEAISAFHFNCLKNFERQSKRRCKKCDKVKVTYCISTCH